MYVQYHRKLFDFRQLLENHEKAAIICFIQIHEDYIKILYERSLYERGRKIPRKPISFNIRSYALYAKKRTSPRAKYYLKLTQELTNDTPMICYFIMSRP